MLYHHVPRGHFLFTSSDDFAVGRNDEQLLGIESRLHFETVNK